MAATVAGYLAAGTIDVSAAPFSTSKSVHDLLHDTLETLWTLAALSAIALASLGPPAATCGALGEGQADVDR